MKFIAKNVLYEIFCKKIDSNFLQIFFLNKIYKYFFKKKIKTKLTGNMSFFSSVWNYEQLKIWNERWCFNIQ